jgi:hypothetical protein
VAAAPGGKLVEILRPEELKAFPVWERELTPEELRQAYIRARATFSADDLQKYTEPDEGVAFEEVLAELDEAERRASNRSD